MSLAPSLLTSCAEVPLALATANSSLQLADRFLFVEIKEECEWAKPILFDDESRIDLLTDSDLKQIRLHNELHKLYCIGNK